MTDESNLGLSRYGIGYAAHDLCALVTGPSISQERILHNLSIRKALYNSTVRSESYSSTQSISNTDDYGVRKDTGGYTSRQEVPDLQVSLSSLGIFHHDRRCKRC